MKWWIVTCRIAYDDEDSIYIGQHETQDQAEEAAEAMLRNDDNKDLDFYINYVITCDTQPTMVSNNAGLGR